MGAQPLVLELSTGPANSCYGWERGTGSAKEKGSGGRGKRAVRGTARKWMSRVKGHRERDTWNKRKWDGRRDTWNKGSTVQQGAGAQ